MPDAKSEGTFERGNLRLHRIQGTGEGLGWGLREGTCGRVKGVGFRVKDAGCRVQGAGLRTQEGQ